MVGVGYNQYRRKMKKRLLPFLAIVMFFSPLQSDDPKTIMVFPDANSRMTFFSLHHIHEAQTLSKGKGIKVGILDHSFGLNRHPELYTGGRNFVEGSEEFLTEREWHGYWMANTLHEVAPDVEIFALNTVPFEKRETHAEVISKAIDWAITQKIDILTYSQESIKAEYKPMLNAALDRAHKAGIITVFIHTGHPGNIMPTGLWSGKDDGREADVNIYHYDYSIIPIPEYLKLKNKEKTWWNPPFLSVSSTAPILGGIIAMMKSLKPSMTSEECRYILQKTSFPFSFEGEQAPHAINAFAALKKVLEK